MDSPDGQLVHLTNAEVVSPETGYGAFEHLVLIPVCHGATFSTYLNIKARGAAHIKRHHVVVGVTTQCSGVFDLSSNPSVVAATHFINVVDLKHHVYAACGHRHFKKPKAVVPLVAMHEPQARNGLIGVWRKAQLHHIGQAEAQDIRQKSDRLIKVGSWEYNVAHPLLAGDKILYTRR